MHDAIEVDDHGKPGAALITEPFIPTAEAIAKVRALPDYPYVLLKHPLGSLNDDELRSRAKTAAAQAVEILTGGKVKF